MFRNMLRSKIHRATVTGAELHYEGSVTIDRDLLCISGIRKAPSGGEVRRLHQMEIAFGAFERSIRIAVPFERDRASAHLEDGFLEVRVPKRLPAKQRVELETE